MELIQVKNQPLEEYITIIRNSFNGNNYVFQAKCDIKRENKITEQLRFHSAVGPSESQNKRLGIIDMTIFKHTVSSKTEGLESFLYLIKEAYTMRAVDFISTRLYDSQHEPPVTIDYYKPTE